jgi:hypothetical protein
MNSRHEKTPGMISAQRFFFAMLQMLSVFAPWKILTIVTGYVTISS